MPFTPFHFGPALMFGLLFFLYLDFPTFIVANIGPDIESSIGTMFHLSYSWYGWFHTREGATVAIILIAIVMYFGQVYASKVLRVFKLQQQTSSFKKILLTSFIGVSIHLLLDAPLHYLLDQGVLSIEFTPVGILVYGFCIFSFLISLILYKRRIDL